MNILKFTIDAYKAADHYSSGNFAIWTIGLFGRLLGAILISWSFISWDMDLEVVRALIIALIAACTPLVWYYLKLKQD